LGAAALDGITGRLADAGLAKNGYSPIAAEDQGRAIATLLKQPEGILAPRATSLARLK